MNGFYDCFSSRLNTPVHVVMLQLSLKYVTGWGRNVGGGSAADILQQGMLPIASHAQGVKKNSYLVPVVKNKMVCAGSGVINNAGGCQGDSGGPFVCQEGGRWVLRGAVSWGNPMCKTDHYTVFARVSNYLDWISQKMTGKHLTKMSVNTCSSPDHDEMELDVKLGNDFYINKLIPGNEIK